MPHLLTLGQVKGKAGVFLMYVAHSRTQCSGPTYLVSDGKRQWMGHVNKYHAEYIFEERWLYEPTNLSWQNFAKGARPDSTGIKWNSIPKLKVKRGTLLLCDTPRS